MSKKLTIEEMHKIAESRGGKCLSDEYGGNKIKLKWRCSEEHEWEAIPSNVKRGSWCQICRRKSGSDKRRGTIDDMRTIAKIRGGECLSAEYVDSQTKLKWRCKDGHEWEARPNGIKTGTWCPYCVGKNQTIEDMRTIAKERRGECLSEDYVNAHTKLKWRCNDGHEWEATSNDIKNSQWCPICSQGVSERICRATFENIFSEKFPKKRPKWLINPETGRSLELDGYCEKLSIAFEFQGEQHYQENHYFHSHRGLAEQKKFDQLKKELCKKYGIILIVVPMMDYKKIATFIVKECKNQGIITKPLSIDAFDYKGFDVYSPHKLERMQKCAKSRGGECLSDLYVNSRTKLRWQCKEGHEWDAPPDRITSGSWCMICAGIAPLTIEEMQDIAKVQDGECLSTEYINSSFHLRWKCKAGHEWEASPKNIKKGKWCPHCSGNIPLTIEEMQGIAKAQGGECLSNEYINNITKLKWRCSKGHVWKAVPSSIKAGTWCPYCAGNIPLTMEEMHKIANARGGECLSKEYLSAHKKLRWRCSEGHEWEATPRNVKRSTWCPHCAGIIPLTMEEMQGIAEAQGGECLSEEYVNANTKLRWKCKEGHEWEALPSSIKTGTWCPYCAGRHQTIDDMRKIAESRGGDCLSEEYGGNKTKLTWKCSEGHEWKAGPSNIKRGSWCPTCGNKKGHSKLKDTIMSMRTIAKSHGGECLSEEYVDTRTKLKWRCSEGHEWKAAPGSVKHGTWCPHCGGSISLTIKEMQGIAKSRGGECLSNEYVNSSTKLKWRCSEKHEWEATPRNVKRATWCPYCAGRRK